MPTPDYLNTALDILMVLLAVYVVLTMGEGLFPGVKRRYGRRSYADRGLCFDGRRLPENSSAAVLAAAAQQYGSRIDVRITADGIPVAFADDDLMRAAGDPRRISDLTFEQLAAAPVFGGARVETLEEILHAVSALETPVPLLLTLWPPDPDPEKIRAFCAAVTEVLYPHRTICMVESVSTDVICFYKKNCSNIVRGMRMVTQEESGMTEKEYRLVSFMLRNMKTRPQFFDTTEDLRSVFYWLPVTMGSFLIMRGVTDETSREKARSVHGVEAVIFRGGAPKATF